MTLVFPLKTLVSPKCLHVSAVRHNLTSVFARVYFADGTEVIIKRNGSFICSGGIKNGLHLLSPSLYEIHDTEIVNTPHTLPLTRVFFYQSNFGVVNSGASRHLLPHLIPNLHATSS